MATMPKTVERQLREAEALQASLQVAPDPTIVTDASQLVEQPPPALTVVPPPAPAPQPVPAPAAAAVDWEQKFKTMQGMYNAEVPRLQAQARTSESEMVALKEQVRALAAAAQQSRPEPAKPEVAPKDIENFGADLIDMVQRQAVQTHGALRAEFESRIKVLEDAISGVSQQTSVSLEKQYYTLLEQLVPDFRQINGDERWLTWLAVEDPTLGITRQAVLNRAHQNGDAQRVAAIFNAFKLTLQPPRESLENQVAPVSTGTAPVSAEPLQAARKQFISSKFVQAFFKDVALHRYVGREQEAARIEAEINQAAAEGRIV